MIIEVAGVNTWNKGAELMLVAVRDHFLRHHPDVKLAVNQVFGGYADRGRYGLLQKMEIERWGRSRLALSLMPDSFRRAVGVVTEQDIDAVLDASGFAFGDQHPAARTEHFAEQVERWRGQGKAVVLLPQALGPFEKPRLRDAFARVVDAANLVFARDEVSLNHVRKAAGSSDHVKLAPDFTILVKPEGEHEPANTDQVCIVPNQRMVEKAEKPEEAAAYVPMMATCIREVEAAGLRPVLLLHGTHDADLVKDICTELGHEVPQMHASDPVEIKRILGRSHLVIASRFHALVSALSQGVPCIATSWSHKYEMLFRDYGCEEMILSVQASREQIQSCIHAVNGSSSRAGIVAQVQAGGKRVTQQVKDMWTLVDQTLGLV